MSLIDLPDKALTELAKSADKHLGKSFDNLTEKPTQSIGNGISDIIDIVFSVFKLCNTKIQGKIAVCAAKFKKEIEEISKSIPEDKLTEPDVQTITTALDNSKYCVTNDELREMFVNLIGSACNSDKKDAVHPAFSAIIKEMSSQDARVLKDIKELANYKEFRFSNICEKCGGMAMSSPVKMSVDNLVRLGLLSVNYKLDQKEIEREAMFYGHNIACSPNDFKLISDTDYSFTLMGKSFVEVCC